MALPAYYAQRSQRLNSNAGQSSPVLSQEQEDSMLQSIAKNIGGAVQGIGMAIDTPGAIARGFMAGDPYSGFSWDADRRVTGEELNQQLGLTDDNTNPYLSSALGLATEIGTDPLTWLTGPLGSLGKAGKAAKEVDLLSLAPLAAQRRMGQEAAETLTGRYTKQALDALGDSIDNVAASEVRPLVGPRLAQGTTTLRELVDVADDPVKALDDLTANLSGKGLTFDDVADDRLGGLFGFGFVEPDVAYMPEGQFAETALDAMDLVGQKLAWSPVGRYASALFDKNVEGATEAGDQIMAMRHSKELGKRRAAGQQLAAEHAFNLTKTPLSDEAKALLGADNSLSEEGNSLFLRLSENHGTEADKALLELVPNLGDALASWDKIRKHNYQSAKELGINATELVDRFGTQFSPRTGSAFDLLDEYGQKSANTYDVRLAHAYGRNPNLIVPGGTDTLREISKLPVVREHAQLQEASPYSHQQVAQEIQRFLGERFGPDDAIPDSQAEGIARVMYRLRKDLPDNYAAFAEHPINMQAQSIVQEEVRRGNAEFVYDSLAEVASPVSANQQVGGGYKSIQASLNDLANSVGFDLSDEGQTVAQNLKERIASRLGTTADQVDLNSYSIPEKMIERLGRVSDFYSSPRAQQEVTGLFDKFTALTKSFLLAWPSRHLRDSYSNLFSVWLEAGRADDIVLGYAASGNILAGDYSKAMPALRELPQYMAIADDETLLKTFMGDVGRTGILSGISQDDYLTANRLGEIQRLVPGAQPMQLSNALDAFKGTTASDFFQVRGVTNQLPTRNPILNASEAINNYNDSLARLGGMIALMKQGATADHAAARMQAALVDYQSLTTFESTLKKIFPWYSYQSRIGKYVVDSMLRNPGGRYGQAIRAMNTLQASDDDTYIPSSLQQQFAFRLPDSVVAALGKPVGQDTTTFLTDLDIPGVDTLNLFSDNAEDTLANIALQTNPAIKTFIEMATGRDLFSKRPLRQADTGADRIYRYLTGDTEGLSPTTKAIVQNIPGTQRPVNFIGGLLDTRLPSFSQRLGKQAFNAVSGFKITDVDPAWQLQDARQKNLDSLKDYSNEYTTRFIPKDRLETAPQDIKDRAALERVLSKRYRDYLKQRPQRQPIYNPLLEMIGGGE